MKRICAGLLALCLLAVFLPAGAEKTVTLSFAGDVTLGGEERTRGREDSFDSLAAREGYDYFFRNVKAIFDADDLTLVNLEGVLSDSSAGEDRAKTFRFRGQTDYAVILQQASIEACAISNNHIMDYGRRGYDNTRATLDLYGIRYCGNEYSFILEKDGIRIGFFALISSAVNSFGPLVRDSIARMRAEGVNAIVCSFHAGQEYAPRRRDRDQVRYARTAIEEWGADLVIMHHPHVVQGVDMDRNRYIFYSLGNFCFGGNLQIRSAEGDAGIRTLESMIVRMDLHFSDDGQYLGQEGRIYPCYISSSAKQAGDPNDFQPKLVTGPEAQGVMDRIQFDTSFDLGTIGARGYAELPFLPAPEAASRVMAGE